MKYFSEVTNKVYDTMTDLAAAEKEVEELEKQKKAKENQRKERYAELKAAVEARNEKWQKFNDEINEDDRKLETMVQDFIKDYGSLHFSLKDLEVVQDLFDNIVKFF